MRRRIFPVSYTPTERRLRRATARARERLAADLRGEILEIGAGTGANLGYYRAEACVTATDHNEHMLRRAGPKQTSTAADIEVQVADAMALPFADARFDAVVATLVHCSVPDQQAALAEIRRVLKPGDALRLLEHVCSGGARSPRSSASPGPVRSALCDGCHLDRDTEARGAHGGVRGRGDRGRWRAATDEAHRPLRAPSELIGVRYPPPEARAAPA